METMRKLWVALAVLFALLFCAALLRRMEFHKRNATERSLTATSPTPHAPTAPADETDLPLQLEPPQPDPTTSSEQSLELSIPGQSQPRFDTYGLSKKHKFIFLSPREHQPVAGAHVIVFRSSDQWSTYDMSNVTTDLEGSIEVTTKLGIERLILHAFKPGVASGTEGFSGSNPEWRIVLDVPRPLKIFCTSRTGYLRGNCDLTIVAELRWKVGSEVKWLKFPPRRMRTDEYGRCEVEGLPYGSRIEITATWESRTATVTLDEFPKQEVSVVID